MTRRALGLGLAIAGLIAAALPASAQTKWNLPAAYPSDNPHTENLVLFSKDVEKATGGKLVITVHPNASLFKAPDIKRAVATGQAQMGEILLSIHENEDPIFGIDVVPFMATSFPPFDIRRTSFEVRASSISFGAIFSVRRWMASNLSIAFL